jgi:biotin transport system substrate-specific component
MTTTLRQTKPSTIGWTIGFALILTAAAQITVPIPGTPVPFTLQPLVVVLAGLMLGPVAGTASMVLYLLAGAAGLPVFSPVGAPGIARFFGPTGGYLIAYPVAAWIAGTLGHNKPRLLQRFLAACAGIAVIFIGGISQLTIINGSVSRALSLGFTWFAPLDLVKALIAAAIARPRFAPTSESLRNRDV